MSLWVCRIPPKRICESAVFNCLHYFFKFLIFNVLKYKKLTNCRFFLKNMAKAVACFTVYLALSGCDPVTQDPIEIEIALTAPANNATFDLSSIDEIPFSWTRIDIITGYILKFALDEAGLSNSVATVNAGNSGSYELTSEAAEIMIGEISDTQPGEEVEIFWTVVPSETPENTIVTMQSRKITITRLAVAIEPYLDVATELLLFEADPEEPQTVSIESNKIGRASCRERV